MIDTQKLKGYLAPSKRAINILIILATLGAAVYYFLKHHDLVTNLKHVSPLVGIEVLGLYIVKLVVLILVFYATMRLVDTKLNLKENGYINAYSLFMNFFVPGQTGPAYRGYYMKKHHKLRYLDYTLATIFYYMIYGTLSVIFVVTGSQPYYYTIPIIIIVISIAATALWVYMRKHQKARIDLAVKNVLFLVIATLSQLIIQSIIFFIEIHNAGSHASIGQVVTYTGTAELAVFAALTPGAIGIREGLLVLTEKLNHISSSTIVLANVIDRSVYIIFLLVLGLAILLLKVKERLA